RVRAQPREIWCRLRSGRGLRPVAVGEDAEAQARCALPDCPRAPLALAGDDQAPERDHVVDRELAAGTEGHDVGVLRPEVAPEATDHAGGEELRHLELLRLFASTAVRFPVLELCE